MESLTAVLETGGRLMDNPLMSPISNPPPISAGSADVSLAVLIKRGRDGDTGAMETIYLRFKGPFFSLALRYGNDRATAEDLLQDIFIKIFTHLGDVRSAEMFPGWAYRIALNTCFSHLRQKRTKTQRTISLTEMGDTVHDERAVGSGSDFRPVLQDAIGRLPHRLKEIFILHDVQGFKHEEIAEMLRLSVGTSKSQLFKARLKIRNFLKTKSIGSGERS